MSGLSNGLAGLLEAAVCGSLRLAEDWRDFVSISLIRALTDLVGGLRLIEDCEESLPGKM